MSGINKILCIGVLWLFVTIGALQAQEPLHYLTHGGRAEFARDGRIAFHRRGEDGKYDIWLRDGMTENCLTCDIAAFDGRHVGQPSWHPSREYLVFQLEMNWHVPVGDLVHPGLGAYNDIYLMRLGDQKIWPLQTLTPVRYSMVLHPHFCDDGRLISWAERIGPGGGEWGDWRLIVAGFTLLRGNPVLAPMVQLDVPGYIESNDCRGDGQPLLISGYPGGQPVQDLDIGLISINLSHPQPFGRWVPLTQTPEAFDESAHLDPTGHWVAYLSTEGFPPVADNRKWWKDAQGEFWLHSLKHGTRTRLTFFNQAGSVHWQIFQGRRVVPAYVTWGPTGLLALSVGVETEKGAFEDHIFVMNPFSQTDGGTLNDRGH